MKPASTRSHSHHARGFTLVEIMVVVVIIGLLAALAVPAYKRVQRAAQNSRAENDFRIFAQTMEIFCSQNGFWPANAVSGQIPPGMNGDFKTDAWKSTTVIGGKWNWDKNKPGFAAGISIVGFTCDDAQLAEIDAKIDDGNLTTGSFQKTAADRVTLILEI